jgi:L-Ala-D/L-Glu epimerase
MKEFWIPPNTMNIPFELEVHEQSWPLDKPFRIARGARTEARVIVATVGDGRNTGRGEGVPYAHYGESVASTLAQIEELRSKSAAGLDRHQIQTLLPAGAARNALDCALWDFEAKSAGQRAWELMNLPIIKEIETSFTVSLDEPEAMAMVAKAHSDAPVLKLKLQGDALDLPRVQAVRQAAPGARLLVDANESWSPSHYLEIAPALSDLGVELIEQPFPAKDDQVLKTVPHPVPVCADESCHTTADLPRLAGLYEVINLKLDKTGGLTEALRLAESARQSGFKLFIGCMVCTSLGIAPARILARAGDYIDLDGPLLLAGDRHHGLSYQNGRIGLPSPELWG